MKGYIHTLLVAVVCVSAPMVLRISGEARASTITNAGLFSESQTFDTEAAATIGGWVGLNTASDGNAYGFSNTDFTGGTSPAGEAGGTIARTADRSYYGDVTLNGVLTLDDRITASGEFNFIEQAFNNNIQIGHFDPTESMLVNTLGISVSEAHNPAKDFLITAFISLSDGTHLFSPALLISGTNVARTWSYTWDPEAGTAGMLTVSISGPDGGTVVLSLNPAERETGAFFSAFGLSSGSIGEADANNRARLFVDNVSYTTANDLAQCQADLAQAVSDLALCNTSLTQTQANLNQCNTSLTICTNNLEQVDTALGQCTTALADARAALAVATADTDHDGRRDVDDACPGTAPGAAVDQAGCSLAQFCAAIDATTPTDEKICRNSDWKNDEPLMKASDADCTVDEGGLGHGHKRCVPRI